MRLQRLLAAALIVGNVLLAPHVSQAAPDNTLGMGLMSANVNADGTFVADSGSGVVSSTHDGVGLYKVTFSRSLAGCSCVGSHFAPDGSTNATVTVTGFCGLGLDNKVVTVRTYLNSLATFQDRPFQLIVFCPK
jgi:hypothetical protein